MLATGHFRSKTEADTIAIATNQKGNPPKCFRHGTATQGLVLLPCQ
jgi:hypothetical protein